MDSKPVKCLPKGSVVTLLKTKVSTEYEVLSRRALVRHVEKDPTNQGDIVTEGWASIQSSQGYVILSPLSTICYTNTAWGGTRPIIKQCGHAAHLKCVETHTLSLHQRAAGDQPYDGRFAANIADGEFLCPLCKQLSNILIPRDIFEVSSKVVDSGAVVAPRSLRLIVTGSRSAHIEFESIYRRALQDYGSHLYNAMNVPWERASRRKKDRGWYPALQKWDYEEDDDGQDGSDGRPRSAKGVLRLLRQQLIAWAAVGHSASSCEAASRGVEEVLPFGILSQTNDPWSDFGEDSRDNHPMLLELKRTLTGACGLYEVTALELGKILSPDQSSPEGVFIVASCLVDILEGTSWMTRILSGNASETSSAALWSQLTALVSSMPCHVARDGVLLHRCEARATASAMWALKGLGSGSGTKGEPPAPLAVESLIEAGLPAIEPNWGSMDPFVAFPDESPPFRPGIASSYLYRPLLQWDLYTLSSAVLSCAICNSVDRLPTGEELLSIARVLLVGRMIQVLAIPFGFELPDEMELEEQECWSDTETQTQGPALAYLANYCQSAIKGKSTKFPLDSLACQVEYSSVSILAGVGQAILPFARALVLMMRACVAAIEERRMKAKIEPATTPSDAILATLLFGTDSMTTEDGFHLAKVLQAPLPTDLVGPGEWKQRIDRWLMSAIGFELHHGSLGKSILPTSSSAVQTRRNQSEQNLRTPVLNPAPLSENTSNGSAPSADIDGVLADGMDIDDDTNTESADRRFPNQNNSLMDEELDGDSDEEIMDENDDSDDAEEMVDFEGRALMGEVFGASPSSAASNDANESDDSSAFTESDSREFANVGRSPILPHQPSTLGVEGVGPGRQGKELDSVAASALMADLSHLGMIHRAGLPTFSLVRLPNSFVELYTVVSKIKGRDDGAAGEDADDSHSAETAICLLTGTVMRSGSSRRGISSRASRPPGACTMHARRHGSGIGIFFLVQKCTVLLMHNNKSAYSPSLYVDEHGEEDPGLRRGRPLFLNEARFRALEGLWRQQGIPREVAQIRSTSDRVIRDNWY